MTVDYISSAQASAPPLPGFLSDLRDDSPFIDPAPLRNKLRPEIKFAIAASVVALCSLAAMIILVAFDPRQSIELDFSTPHLLWALVGFFEFAGLVATLFAITAMGFAVLLAFRYGGYVITSWIAGDRLEFWFVGPLGVIRRTDELRYTLHRSRALSKWGALGTIGSDQPYSRPWEITRVAGPCAGSFVLASLSGLIAVTSLLVWLSGADFAFVGLYLGISFGAIGIYSAVACLSDLWSLFRMWTDESRCRMEYVLRTLSRATRRCNYHRDTDPNSALELVELSLPGDIALPTRVEIARELFTYYIDQNDLEQAGNQIATLLSLLDQTPRRLRQILTEGTLLNIYDSAALYYGFYAPDPLSAFAWLSRANEESVAPRPIRLQSEAAALLASGRFDEARVRAVRALELASAPELPEIQVDHLQAIIHASERAQADLPLSEPQ